MSQAIIISSIGGPEVLKLQKQSLKHPGQNELLITHSAIGVNFIDIYHRNGTYQTALPFVPGIEACGYVDEVGEGVEGFQVGDRVAYATAPGGAYSHSRIIDAKYVVAVPDFITDEEAAAILTKGLTAHYLLKRTYFVKPGDTLLIHAAAGGVGSLMCQWAKYLKAKVIGTVGSDEKIAIAKTNGCDHVFNYRAGNLVAKVKEVTNGKGVVVAYDGVGKDTFLDSVACLDDIGLMVSYGQASGPVPPVDISIFTPKSLFFTRPSLFNYKEHRMELVLSAYEVFDTLKNKTIKANIAGKYKLADAALAHADLEQRKIIGSSILVP